MARGPFPSFAHGMQCSWANNYQYEQTNASTINSSLAAFNNSIVEHFDSQVIRGNHVPDNFHSPNGSISTTGQRNTALGCVNTPVRCHVSAGAAGSNGNIAGEILNGLCSNDFHIDTNTNDTNSLLSNKSIVSLPEDFRQSFDLMMQQSSVDYCRTFEDLQNIALNDSLKK